MKSVHSCVAILLSLAACSSTQAQTPALLSVDKAVWTNRIDRESRNYTLAYKSPVQLRQISLWTQLRGTPELLEQMKNSSDGHVRIRHVWKKYVFDGVRIEHDQDLNVGRKEDLRKLSSEVAATGFFQWRVWSDKVILTPGSWRVDVVWDSDEPVMCSGSSGERACSYSIQVR